MRSVRNVALAVLALSVFGASVASAQRRPAQRASSSAQGYWEIGAEAALTFGLDDPKTTSLQIPVGIVRAGYFMAPEWSIEPFFSFDYVNVDGGGSGTDYTLGVGVPYHLSPSRTESQLYVRPFLAIIGFSVNPDVGPSTSDSDVALGAGIGMKWPKLNGRMAWRGELNFAHLFSDPGQSSIGALFGISFFTR